MANWLDNSTDALNRWIQQNSSYPTNGYSTTAPQYNLYSTKFSNYKPTQPAPPINQALNENFQPQYVQTTNYNGQPVRVPTNAFSQLSNTVTQGVSDALDWAKQQAIQRGMMTAAGGLAIGMPLLSTRLALSNNPLAQRAGAAISSTRLGNSILGAAKNVANNPYVQKADRLAGRIGDWFY